MTIFRTTPIAWSVAGDGPPILLAHGWAAARSDWQAQIPALVQAGYRIYALDHLGHGESAKPGNAAAYTLTHVYAAFCAWVDSLNLTAPFALIGHSMGGYISLWYAAEHPGRVRALGLIDPLYTRAQFTPSLKLIFSQPHLLAAAVRLAPARSIAALYRFTPHRLLPLSTRLEIARSYKHASPLIAHILHRFPSLEDRLPQVKAPTLLLYGEQDLSLAPASFPNLAHQLPNLVSQHRFSHTGHTPHVDCPQEVNDLLIGFLSG
jgi:pimeloyl-ACP methyl ester carboxylesterase